MEAGVSDADARRQGRWNGGAMTGTYLDGTTPIKALRVCAGFTKKDNWFSFRLDFSYLLKRDLLKPPETLKRMIFPQLEEQREIWMRTGVCISGRGFFDFFFWLR